MADTIEKAYALCVQGKVNKALQVLEKEEKPSPFLKYLRKAFRTPFEFTPRGNDSLLKAVSAAYSSYYRKVLMGESAEKDLLTTLNKILTKFKLTCASASFDDVEAALIAAFRARKINTLFGIIRPHRSFLAWKTETVSNAKVPLVEGIVKLKVVTLSNFLFENWMYYATNGKHHPGGWNADSDTTAIYHVKKKKPGARENFRVNILHHEGQHFFDLQRFATLDQIDMEYRAKLAELVTCKDKNTRLFRFFSQADADRKSPHAFAAHVLKKHFQCRFGKAKRMLVDDIGEEARLLLLEHSALLKKDTVTVMNNAFVNRDPFRTRHYLLGSKSRKA